MISRDHLTCSSLSKSWQEIATSFSTSPSPNYDKAIRCPLKISVSWKKRACEQDVVVRNARNRETDPSIVMLNELPSCSDACEGSCTRGNMAYRCCAERTLCCVRACECSVLERILDTEACGNSASKFLKSEGILDTEKRIDSEGNFLKGESILDTERHLNTDDNQLGKSEGILDTCSVGREGHDKHLEKVAFVCREHDRHGGVDVSCCPNFTLNLHFYSKSKAVQAVAGCGALRAGEERRRRGEERREGREGSPTRVCHAKKWYGRTRHKIWNLLSLYTKQRTFCLLFVLLLTSAVSAHPLNASNVVNTTATTRTFPYWRASTTHDTDQVSSTVTGAP
ncbi:hypothetical protein FHG87_024918 [Trinorchestia longiramus]|nr:hypothetical protein FHG87_024918 [Trinorchestia longiramus]